MVTKRILPVYPGDKKTLEALIVLLSLKFTFVVALALLSLTIVLFVFSVLLQAAYQCCQQIAQVWSESGAVEKLCLLVVVWMFCAWLAHFIRSLKNATQRI